MEGVTEQIGIPRGRLYTLETQLPGGRRMETGRDALELLNGILDAHPESKTLVVFPGRVPGMPWEDFVVKIYEAVAMRCSPEAGPAVALSMQKILEQVGAVREDLAAMAARAEVIEDHSRQQEACREVELAVARTVGQILESIRLEPSEVIEKTRERFLLYLVSGGTNYVMQGRIAQACGVIDGAYDVVQAGTDPGVLKRSIEFTLAARR
jgi:hypothetical protein